MGLFTIFQKKFHKTEPMLNTLVQDAEPDHEQSGDEAYEVRRIIQESAKRELEPLGLFQKGRSRFWIDDNQWFVTLVEYQPTPWEKGSYLNVAIHFLWTYSTALTHDYGGRREELVKCKGNLKQLAKQIDGLTEVAVRTVREYRSFRKISYALSRMTRFAPKEDDFFGLYHCLMISGLAQSEDTRTYYDRLIDLEKATEEIPGWQAEYFTELHDVIEPLLYELPAFSAYVRKKVIEGRKRLSAEPGFDRMREETV